MLNTILFFGRKNCIYSCKIRKFLQKKSKKLIYIESKSINEKLNKNKFSKKKIDYIFCFRSFYILSKSIITKAKYGAINFHPGPPEYRGVGAANFAIYNNNKNFGFTVHFMNEKIDHGRIISVRRFKLNNKDTIKTVLHKTYRLMYKEAISIINNINKNSLYLKEKKENKKNCWSKKINNLKSLNKFYEISKKITKIELKRKLRATVIENHMPYIRLHGHIFQLKIE